MVALAIGAGLLGCGPDYPIAYETPHLRVAKTFDAPICAGTLRDLELDAARISELLGGEDRVPIELVLGVDAVTEHCPANADGCAEPGGPVWTNFSSVGHELVHAFAGAGSNRFVEEGLAEALGGGRLRIHTLEVEPVAISIEESILDPEVEYAVAGHFVTWLIERRGLEAFSSFRAMLGEAATLPEINSAFEAVYGESLAQAEASWRETAPSRYEIGFGDCAGASEAWREKGRWVGRLEADCGAEQTFGPLGDWSAVQTGMRRTVLVDVVHRGDYELAVTATRAGSLELDATTCGCWSGPESRETLALTDGSQSFGVYLWPCRYRISYVVAGIEEAAADVELKLVEGA